MKIDCNTTNVPSWPVQVRRLHSREALSLGILESTAWAKLERNPIMHPNANEGGLCIEKVSCMVGKVLVICGDIGHNCRCVPQPAMFRSNRKSQLEMNVDFGSWLEVFPKIQNNPQYTIQTHDPEPIPHLPPNPEVDTVGAVTSGKAKLLTHMSLQYTSTMPCLTITCSDR